MTQGLLRLMPALISTPVWYCLWLRREGKLTHWDQLKIVDLGSKSLLHLSKLSSNARRSNSHLVQSSPSTDDLAVQRFFRSFLFFGKSLACLNDCVFPSFFEITNTRERKKSEAIVLDSIQTIDVKNMHIQDVMGDYSQCTDGTHRLRVACRLSHTDSLSKVIFSPKIWNNCHIRNINCSFTHAFKLLFPQYASG